MLSFSSSAGLLASEILRAERECSAQLSRLRFPNPPVHTVYDPLQYAWAAHEAYVRRAVSAANDQRPAWRPVMMLGMNPGPFGMAQNGVPFGEAAAVREFVGLDPSKISIGQPERVHPKRPIQGFQCTKSEVSGKRLWGWAADRYGQDFFTHFFVANYCPLVFMGPTGANVVPSRLRKADRALVEEHCDRSLVQVVDALRPRLIIGVGDFAYNKAAQVLGAAAPAAEQGDRPEPVPIEKILHPSPASPAANRGWAEAADAAMADIWDRHATLLADIPPPGSKRGSK